MSSRDRDIDNIYVAADGVPTARVQEEIETIMRETRRIGPDREDDFSVRDMTQIAFRRYPA